MLLDKHGKQVTPIWYDRGSSEVLVKYQDGAEPVLLPVSAIVSRLGEEYVARVIRAVRVP